MKRWLMVSVVVLLVALTPATAESFGVYMLGANETPAGDPDGVGFADLDLDGTTLHYSVMVYNIEAPTAIHIHPGARGQNGSPLVPIATPWTRLDGCPASDPPACAERFVNAGEVEVSEAVAQDFRTHPSDFYLNVHNVPHGPGAVRGQLQFARYLPNVGETPGAGGTHWFTRFAVANLSRTEATAWAIEIIPQSPFGNTARFVVPQDDLFEMRSHVDTEFPVPNFTGLGSARILSDRPLAANAAVYNGVGGGRGDFGYAMKGVGIEHARSAGVLIDLTTASAEDLQAGVGHRTNVGYLNPQFRDVIATFSAVGADGVVLGSKVVVMPPGAMAQIPVFDLVDTVSGPASVSDGFWVDWTADAPIFVYATVVNNHTGDAEVRD